MFEEFTFDDFSTEMVDTTVRKTKKYSFVWKIGYGGTATGIPFIYEAAVYFG